jgi:hypothetical protein
MTKRKPTTGESISNVISGLRRPLAIKTTLPAYPVFRKNACHIEVVHSTPKLTTELEQKIAQELSSGEDKTYVT